jgi:hypothetical protein
MGAGVVQRIAYFDNVKLVEGVRTLIILVLSNAIGACSACTHACMKKKKKKETVSAVSMDGSRYIRD